MAGAARVLQEALSLDPGERARVARELIRSLEEADSDAEALWREEIHRRIDEIEAGTADLEDWDAVRGQLLVAVKP